MIQYLICSKDWKFDSEWLINGFATEAIAYRGKYNSIHILYREAKIQREMRNTLSQW